MCRWTRYVTSCNNRQHHCSLSDYNFTSFNNEDIFYADELVYFTTLTFYYILH